MAYECLSNLSRESITSELWLFKVESALIFKPDLNLAYDIKDYYFFF